MLGGITSLLSAWGHALGIAAALAVALLVYLLNKDGIDFWVLDLRYRFPFIGRLARINDPSESSQPGWLNIERTLCGDYYKYIRPLNRWQFENHLIYLRKAYDTGRKPLPLWMWLFLGVLIVAEGLGFSYLLGSQMALEGSENTRTLLMIAIVLVISGILMWVTHAAGHQLYRTGLLKSCFYRFRRGGHGKQLSPRLIKLGDDQKQDDEEDEASQCVSRIKSRPGDTGGLIWVIVAAIAIVSIGGGSTWLRFAHFEAARTENTVADASNPFASGGPALPDAVTAPQAAADAKAALDGGAAATSEAMAAFIMLGFIFVVTQLVGIGAGYRYGFAGRESDRAFHETGGHSHFDSYWAYFQRRIDLTQSRLQELQQAFEARSDHDIQFTKKFADYVREEKQARMVDTFAGDTSAGAGSAANPDAINRAIERMKNTRLETEKVAILAALSDAERAAVKARLREQKGGGVERIADEFQGLL